jgi:hypothetical protein
VCDQANMVGYGIPTSLERRICQLFKSELHMAVFFFDGPKLADVIVLCM